MNDGAGLVYPGNHRQRDQWVVEHRTERSVLDPRRPYAYLLEEECSASGEVVQVSTIFLTNRECPWRCVMCDLWRNTLPAPVPLGAIPEQIDFALARLGSARQVKLYNSGSFFDGGAIPVADYESIASKVNRFDRIIVESHPSLVYGRSLEFRDLLSSPLEVAMGLETVHPEVLDKLNKRMT
jgi:radical SAM enzyme (TIGR01210 family)